MVFIFQSDFSKLRCMSKCYLCCFCNTLENFLLGDQKPPESWVSFLCRSYCCCAESSSFSPLPGWCKAGLQFCGHYSLEKAGSLFPFFL